MLGDVGSGRTGTPSRIVGIDTARGFAILGMFIAHAMPNPSDTELVVDGRSSILFATLAGISLGILSGQDSPAPRGSRSRIYRVVLIRSLFVFLLGVVLASLGSEIAIILDYYAIMFVLVTPLLFLPRIVLGILLGVFAFGAPALAGLVGETEQASSFVDVAREYLLTGYYPALIWVPFLLAGIIAARSGLTRPSVQVSMIVVGSLSAIAGYQVARVSPDVTAEAHSGSTAEIFGSGGVAVAVIGVLLLVTSAPPAPVRRVVTALLSPVSAAGSMALSVYTVQIVALAIAVRIRDSSGAVDYPGWPLLLWLTVGALVGSWLWQRYLGRGPFERVLAAVSGSRAR